MKKYIFCHFLSLIALADISFAMGKPGGGGGTPGFVGLLPILLMFFVIYFLIIFPQQRKQKQHREMLQALKKGDRVVTSGGLHGTIANIKETIVVLELDKKVSVDVEKSAITSVRERS
jgi:preprotein translocase subunit YajC